MRYRVLGTTRALTADGTPVPLGGTRLRALLTVLALRPGRTVPVGALIDEVWGGEPPADPVGALQALIGRLRRALGPAAVASENGGYRLCATEEDIDLHRFGGLAGEGARALAGGDPDRAASLLDEALALWTGPALADLPDRTAEAARWETRRLDARRARLTALLALGRAEETLPELAALCGEFPFDEPLQALRIRALRDAARPAEALAAYGEVRHALATRLGTAPGSELRSLHKELLHADEPGSGYGGPPRVPSAPASAGRARTSPARPGNLRARLTSFVGRESDIEAIGYDLGRAGLVTLLGPGGAGKTRLSQEAAERMDGVWPDGVWLAELAPVNDPATVAEAVLTALGARETVLRGAGAEELRATDRHGGDPLARLAEHCGRRRMLLLLDNCEHVIGAAAALADELLSQCPELTILATSREPLGVPGEVVRPVGPLPRDPAVRLFGERARAVRPGFGPEEDPEAVAEICRRLDGLPLAIELAAARLRMLTPRQIADRLDDRFRLLTSGSRTVLPRQQTLRAVVDWSWDLLDEAERAVLRRLSVFAGGCGLTAAEVVCADDPDSARPVPDTGTGPRPVPVPVPGESATPVVGSRDVAVLLGSLIDKSLVVAAPVPDGGDMRYRLLETVAEYTAERLDEAGERGAAERRHLVHHRELARTTDPLLRGPGQRAAIGLLQLEYENLRTALRRAVAAGEEQEALCLVLSLAWFWQMLDLRADARQWAGAASGLGPDPFAGAARQAPPITERCTDAPPPMAPGLLQEARRQVRLIEVAGMDHDMQGWTTPERQTWLATVVRVYRPGLPQTCRFPGTMWVIAVMITGEQELLREIVDGTVRACEELGYEWELAGALQTRANVLANRGESVDAATRDADRSLEIYTRLGDAWGAAEALSARGEAREKAGHYALAAEDYTAAIGYAEGLGARAQVAVLRCRLAATMCETGQGEEGERILRELLEESGETSLEARPAARLVLALWLGRTGRRDEARLQLDLLLEVFRSETLAIFDGFVQGVRAWLDCEDGRYAEALGAARRAQELSLSALSQMVAPEMTAFHLLNTAWALAGLAAENAKSENAKSENAKSENAKSENAKSENKESEKKESENAKSERIRDAARLVGAYEARLPTAHFRTAVEQTIRTRTWELIGSLLGDDAFAAGRAEGAGLSLEEAAALSAPRAS
ncbi:AfsR/SARP family transcriptional regulator [Streptomyces sp. NPDC087658]|uniref:AfsR/SARP family transcriptional regulator n=1 Tax=Streptomyces sp. NPDC087658 TaxID=3365800 RepID=UPI0037F42893